MMKKQYQWRLLLIALAMSAFAGCSTLAPSTNTVPRLTIPFTHKGHVVTNFPWIAEAAVSHSGIDNLILMEPMSSENLRKVFPGAIALRCFAIDAGRRGSPMLNTLLVVDDLPVYIDSDATAAKTVSAQHVEIGKKTEAVELVNAFADLRHFVLQLAPPTKLSDENKPWGKEDWQIITEETTNDWIVTCSFLCWNDPPYVRRYNRYRFRIERTGVITVLESKPLLHEGGYL
jgi:hypothetical protein